MNPSLKLVLLASSIVGLSLAAAPGALGRYHGYTDMNRTVSTSPETGGYCDNAGCPDHFWKFPIHYGPVFFRGQWYRGPLYFRGDRFGRQYWVRGGWHRDEWRGHRPAWARQSYDGPPLAFEYYANHGFRVGDRWRHEHDADSGGDSRWNGGDRHDNGGDHGASWNDTNNAGGQGHSDNGGTNNGGTNNGGTNNGDWRTGATNYDHNRAPGDNNNYTNGPGDQRSGHGNGGQPPSPAANTIQVTTATYGAICHVPPGNVTKFLGDACNGKAMCEYVVRYQTIGDPAPGCAKDFSVQWTCSAGPGGSAAATAEAGLGSKVTLQCTNGGH